MMYYPLRDPKRAPEGHMLIAGDEVRKPVMGPLLTDH